MLYKQIQKRKENDEESKEFVYPIENEKGLFMFYIFYLIKFLISFFFFVF